MEKEFLRQAGPDRWVPQSDSYWTILDEAKQKKDEAEAKTAANKAKREARKKGKVAAEKEAKKKRKELETAEKERRKKKRAAAKEAAKKPRFLDIEEELDKEEGTVSLPP